MQLSIYTDGGAKGNPGPAAIGLIIYNGARTSNLSSQKADNELIRYREDIGVKTNNEAEYGALIKALELAKSLPDISTVDRIDCYSDSELLVKQLNGLYKVKNIQIRDSVFKIRVLESELRVPVHYHHIPREQNVLADALVNDAA